AGQFLSADFHGMAPGQLQTFWNRPCALARYNGAGPSGRDVPKLPACAADYSDGVDCSGGGCAVRAPSCPHRDGGVDFGRGRLALFGLRVGSICLLSPTTRDENCSGVRLDGRGHVAVRHGAVEQGAGNAVSGASCGLRIAVSAAGDRAGAATAGGGCCGGAVHVCAAPLPCGASACSGGIRAWHDGCALVYETAYLAVAVVVLRQAPGLAGGAECVL